MVENDVSARTTAQARFFRFQMLSDETIKAKPTRIVSVRERRLNSRGKAITSSFGCEAPPTTAIRFRIPLPRVTAARNAAIQLPPPSWPIPPRVAIVESLVSNCQSWLRSQYGAESPRQTILYLLVRRLKR